VVEEREAQMCLRETEVEEQLKAVEAERAKVAAERTQLEVRVIKGWAFMVKTRLRVWAGVWVEGGLVVVWLGTNCVPLGPLGKMGAE
jgi:hypothetical protein